LQFYDRKIWFLNLDANCAHVRQLTTVVSLYINVTFYSLEKGWA